MYTGLRHLHSFWAYVVLAMLLIAIISAILGLAGRKEFKGRNRNLALFALIASHIQLLIGLIQYFISPYFRMLMSDPGAVMGSSTARLLAVEHPFINLLAIILITAGYSRHKKAATSQKKFRNIAIFYLIGFLFILSRIPWQNWMSN